jgi:hypothetical protein
LAGSPPGRTRPTPVGGRTAHLWWRHRSSSPRCCRVTLAAGRTPRPATERSVAVRLCQPNCGLQDLRLLVTAEPINQTAADKAAKTALVATRSESLHNSLREEPGAVHSQTCGEDREKARIGAPTGTPQHRMTTTPQRTGPELTVLHRPSRDELITVSVGRQCVIAAMARPRGPRNAMPKCR